MTEIKTIDGGQKKALLRRANIKKKYLINDSTLKFIIYFSFSFNYFLLGPFIFTNCKIVEKTLNTDKRLCLQCQSCMKERNESYAKSSMTSSQGAVGLS